MVTNYAPQVAGLHLEVERTMPRIDEALDRGDRRAFAVWCKRWRSLSLRTENLLVRIATSEA